MDFHYRIVDTDLERGELARIKVGLALEFLGFMLDCNVSYGGYGLFLSGMK